MQAIELSIKTKKVVYRGELFYKVLDYSCYDSERLPIMYFAQFPYCFNAGNMFLYIAAGTKDEDNYELRIGDLIPKDDFEKVIEIIRHCGEKLHKINQGIKELKKEWHGEEEFKI